MLKRIICLIFFAVISASCGRVVQPATIVDTSVKSYSPEEREYLVEAYRESYLNAINERAELEAFLFPLLKEAAQIAMAIPEKEVPKKVRRYGFRKDVGMYVIGRHLIKDSSNQESLDAWKAIGISIDDNSQRVFKVYKGSAAERAGISAGDSITTAGIVFRNHKGEIYISQNAEKSRYSYMNVQAYCDKRTGKLLDIHLSNYKRVLPPVEVINIYEVPLFRTSQNQLYCKNDENRRSPISIRALATGLSPSRVLDLSMADTLIRVPVGIDNKNPKAAYCSTDRIVIGSAWIREHPDHGAFVFAHELAHFIMGDVNVMIHNIKVKQEREAMWGALSGAMVGVATGVADNVISGHKGKVATANIASHVSEGVAWGALYGSRVGAYLGSLLYSHKMEANADKIALYILARAGYDLEKVRDLWKEHAPAFGYSREGARHPSPQNRDIAMAKTIAEIRLKQRKGLELLPTYQ